MKTSSALDNKVVIIGNKNAGKTQLYKVLTNRGVFSTSHSNTIGYNLGARVISYKEKEKIFNIFDVTKSEIFINDFSRHITSADIIIYVYDMEKPQEINDIDNYITKENVNNKPIYVIGNKSDLCNKELLEQNTTLYENLKDSSKLNICNYYQTSVKDNKNITESFNEIAINYLDQKNQKQNTKEQKPLSEEFKKYFMDIKNKYVNSTKWRYEHNHKDRILHFQHSWSYAIYKIFNFIKICFPNISAFMPIPKEEKIATLNAINKAIKNSDSSSITENLQQLSNDNKYRNSLRCGELGTIYRDLVNRSTNIQREQHDSQVIIF